MYPARNTLGWINSVERTSRLLRFFGTRSGELLANNLMTDMQRPAIFVSATSRDLGTARRLVKEAVLTLDCVPVEQGSFPPHPGTVLELLRSRIDSCQAVIHIAGTLYGLEPRQRQEGEARRSYTQLEYDVARELRKPLYVFVCTESFPYDRHEPEVAELRTLQEAHRRNLTNSDQCFGRVSSADELVRRIYAIQPRFEYATTELGRSRRFLTCVVVAALGIISLLVTGLWWKSGQASARKARYDERELVIKATELFGLSSSEVAGGSLTSEERWNSTIRWLAQEEGMRPEEVQTAINLFVATVSANPSAALQDRALAAFAEQDFDQARRAAAEAASEARARRLAAEQLSGLATDNAKQARASEREASVLQARASRADNEYEEAVVASATALELAPREEGAEVWATMQDLLGSALSEWAAVSTGRDMLERRAMAVIAYHAALEVRTREHLPTEWAWTQNHLAIALQGQAVLSDGDVATQLLTEAVDRLQLALQVVTCEQLPREWAITQNNLAITLSVQVNTLTDGVRARALGDAVQAFRRALQVFARESFPQEWATAQNNLANTLRQQANVTAGAEHARLLREAVERFRLALQVHTRDSSPRTWAMIQNNLALALTDTARASAQNERVTFLGDAIRACEQALYVRTRDAVPLEWAVTQVHLANALRAKAHAIGGSATLLARSADACRLALQVFTQDSSPQQWAGTQNNLGNTLREQAQASKEESPDRCAQLVAEAVEAYRLALQVRTRDALPYDWAETQDNLGSALGDQAEDAGNAQERTRLFGEALEAYRLALQVRTRESLPRQWGLTQQNIAYTLADQSRSASGEEMVLLLRQALEAMDACLSVFTEEIAPETYAMGGKWRREVEGVIESYAGKR